MSGHRYLSSNNPFDEDDVSDEDFLKNSRHIPQQPQNNYYSNNAHATLQTLKEKRSEVENRTLLSSEKSLGILRDSEQIGIATAEELSRQREQLERTDKRLDEINQTLRFSQKHISGIKSVFSSLKNYMSGRNVVQTPSPTTTTGSESLTAQQTSRDLYEDHPITRIREQGLDLRKEPAGSRDFSSRLDANLQEMSSSISTLKGLAKNLSHEIDSHNDLLDNITEKTETADMNINKQNKDMQSILKKK